MYTRAFLTDILARKIARRVGQVGEDHRACPARGKLNGEVAGYADILATISVSVGVCVGPVEFQLYATQTDFAENKMS